MRLWIDGRIYDGRVVDLRIRSIDARELVAAIRRPLQRTAGLTPVIDCATPADVYRYAGFVSEEMGLRVRTALAAAARSRGETTSYDESISDLRETLHAFDADAPSIPSIPEPVPETSVRELEVAVAAHRGRIAARDTPSGEDGDGPRADLQAAVTRLTERATERQAVQQTRKRRREAARAYRRRLDERRRLADRLANQERRARRTLVQRFSEPFTIALDALPGETPPDPFDADPVSAALAVLRVAQTDAPVVLAVDRFASPTAAADYLDAPVIRC